MRFAGIAALLLLVLSQPVVTVQDDELVITRQGTSEYHRPGCPVIRDAKDVLAMRRGQAEARGLKPHKDCDPSQTSPGTSPSGTAAKPIKVFIDEGGKFYHREKCAQLGKSPRQVTIDEAAKKHWPCKVCKPPIRPRPKEKNP